MLLWWGQRYHFITAKASRKFGKASNAPDAGDGRKPPGGQSSHNCLVQVSCISSNTAGVGRCHKHDTRLHGP